MWWTRWTFEPGVVTSLAMLAAMYGGGVWKLWRAAGSGKGISRRQVIAFAGGWLALVAALVSPLDAMSDELLAVHMAQHELLMIVAAPLIAWSSPLVAMMWLFRPVTPRTLRTSRASRTRRTSRTLMALSTPAFVWLLHGLSLWVWHLPLLYDAAVEHDAVHIAQHLSFFGSACLFWWGMMHGRYGRLGYGAAVIFVFATAMHSGVLGALLTLSPIPWYPVYASTTAAWGLSPLEDQQIAGLIMWIPASIVFLVAGLGFFAAWIKESERRVRLYSLR